MEDGVILFPVAMVRSLNLMSNDRGDLLAPCVVPHISHGFVSDRSSGSSIGLILQWMKTSSQIKFMQDTISRLQFTVLHNSSWQQTSQLFVTMEPGLMFQSVFRQNAQSFRRLLAMEWFVVIMDEKVILDMNHLIGCSAKTGSWDGWKVWGEKANFIVHKMVVFLAITAADSTVFVWPFLLQCRDGYMLKGNNTTQCYFGNWTGLTPWCKEVYCPFPGFIDHGKILLVGNMGLYEYRPYVR